MKKIILLSIFISAFICSCGKKTIFEEEFKMESNEWKRFEKLNSKVIIDDIESNYNIYLKVIHTEDYSYKLLNITMVIYTPDEGKRIKNHKLYLKDKEGKFKAKSEGNDYEIIFPLLKNISFTKAGEHHFIIENAMSVMETNGLSSLILIIEKA